MSVDILPSEIPLDSSRHFSKKLFPYIRSLVRSQQGKPLTADDTINLETLHRGTIVENGKLQEPHSWLASRVGSPTGLLDAQPTSTPESPPPVPSSNGLRKRRVLLLGSGMVARPAVNHIATRKDVDLIVGK